MKQICAACVLLLLLGACGGPRQAAETPAPAPAALTRESLLVRYEAAGETVEEITGRCGGFLVCRAGAREGDSRILEWVWPGDGETVRLYGDPGESPVDTYELTGQGAVTLTTTGENAAAPYREFPRRIALSLGGGRVWRTEEALWLPAQTPASMGLERPEAVADARVTLDGVQVSFLPMGSAEGAHQFLAGASTIPLVSTEYQDGLFTLRLHGVALDTGEFADDPEMPMLPYLEENGLRYPHAFPAGALEGACALFGGAEIAADGPDTVITLTPAAGVRYRMEAGTLGPGEFNPMLYLRFQAENCK